MDKKKLWIAIVAVVVIALVVGGFALMKYREASTLKRAESAFNGNQLDAAVAEADAALARNPSDVDALVTKAISLAQKGTLTFDEQSYGAQALAVAQQAVDLNPQSSEAWRALGYAHEIMQKYADAHQAYAKSIALDPENVAALFADAHVYDLQGDIAKAEAGYRATLDVDANFDQAHTGLARIYNMQGNLQGAIAEFRMVYENSPNMHNRAEAAYSLSMLYGTNRDIASAKHFADEAVKYDPSYPLGWYSLGLALFTQSKLPDEKVSSEQRAVLMLTSLDAFKKAVDLNPNQTLALVQASTVFYALKQYDASAETLQKARTAVPLDLSMTPHEREAILVRIAAMEKTVAEAKAQ